MAAFNKAFEGVSLIDDAVTVHGVSEDPHPDDEIYVALAGVDGDPAPQVTHVAHGRAAQKWPAEFAGAAPPYAVGSKVLVVGIALRPDAAPFVWHDTFTIEAG